MKFLIKLNKTTAYNLAKLAEAMPCGKTHDPHYTNMKLRCQAGKNRFYKYIFYRGRFPTLPNSTPSNSRL